MGTSPKVTAALVQPRNANRLPWTNTYVLFLHFDLRDQSVGLATEAAEVAAELLCEELGQEFVVSRWVG